MLKYIRFLFARKTKTFEKRKIGFADKLDHPDLHFQYFAEHEKLHESS